MYRGSVIVYMTKEIHNESLKGKHIPCKLQSLI